ncbi:MAG: hypothetical protein ACYCQI_05750 [Gammaproteobacteria bacterium]
MLNLNEYCFAISFNDIQSKIMKKHICEIDYNPSKTAAIVNLDCGSAVYINFKTKNVHNIVNHWSNIFVTWKSDSIAHLKGPCGTGCSQSIIFIAPTTSIICPIHEYRIESVSQDEPPDFYNNDPLLIEPQKKIYVCYAEDNVIQVFHMPRQLRAAIHPPKGYYAERTIIRDDHLVIAYRNKKGKIKKILYQHIQ